MKCTHLFSSGAGSRLRNALVGVTTCLILSSCARFTGKELAHLSGKAPVGIVEAEPTIAGTSDSVHQQEEKEFRSVTANTDLWPDSWKAYHKRFNNYLAAREKFWPQPEIKFQEPFGLEWDLIVSKGWGSNTSQQKDGIQFYRQGRHYLTRGGDNLDSSLQSFTPGGYAASVWRPAGEYQRMSPPFYFSVIIEENESTGKSTRRIEPYYPKSGDELFPNQWWYYHEDFFWWDTHGRRPGKEGGMPESPPIAPGLKFFTNLRPFEPSIVLEEAEGKTGPIVKRKLLDPKLESLLELRVYYEGRLVKKEPATGIESWTFDHGPGHYVFLIVAPDENSGALIVARPFQAWFPNEGDGVLRITPLDTDKDGIPDYWEKWHDLDPKNPDDADKPYQGIRKTSYLDYFKSQKFYGRVR